MFTVQLYLLAVLKWGSVTTPSLELATRLIRPFAVMISRSLGPKNTGPKVLPDPKTHVHSLLSVPAQSATLLLRWSQIKHKVCNVVQPVNSPTAALSCLETLLSHFTEVHSVGSWIGDNLYRPSPCSGAPSSNDS
jgi:hypothetical protein